MTRAICLGVLAGLSLSVLAAIFTLYANPLFEVYLADFTFC